MARQYAIKTFLRVSPVALLQEYLLSKGIGQEIAWEEVTTRNLTPILDAIGKATPTVVAEINTVFHKLNALDSEGGRKILIDEAEFWQINLTDKFLELESHLEAAFWALIHYPNIFEVSASFQHADSLPGRSWRKRFDIPCDSVGTDAVSKRRLEEGVSAYYVQNEARGQLCKIDHYLRGNQLYWFAYPQDYTTTNLEYDDQNEFVPRPVKPAFEVIFLLDPDFGTLEIYAKGKSSVVEDLQEIFGKTILGVALGKPDKTGVTLNLNHLKDRNFSFKREPSSGIADVRIRRLKLRIQGGGNKRITLEANTSENNGVIYDLLDDLLISDKISLDTIDITSVGFQVEFEELDSRGRNIILSFDVSTPNSCSLKHEPREEFIREHLQEWGIDVTGSVIPGLAKT